MIAVIAAIGCGDDDRAGGADSGTVDAAGGDDAHVGHDAGTVEEDAGGGDVDAGADAGAAETWGTFAEGFFATYCVSCHDTASRDYRTIAHVQRDAATIRCGVSDVMLDGCGSFPPPRQFPVGTGARPSDEERQRLVAWIDGGLAE